MTSAIALALEPIGFSKSTPIGAFADNTAGFSIPKMKTVAEIRRENLQSLIEANGSVAGLNERLGWPRTDPRLTRIRNANARSDRPGKPFQMGDAMAREIESALGLELGWMDNRHVAVFADGSADAVEEHGQPYISPGLAAPASGTDYRTVAYSLAAAIDASNQKVDVRRFLAMVDAAYRNLSRPRTNP